MVYSKDIAILPYQDSGKSTMILPIFLENRQSGFPIFTTEDWKTSSEYRKTSSDYWKIGSDYRKTSSENPIFSSDYRIFTTENWKIGRSFWKIGRDFWKTTTDFLKTTLTLLGIPNPSILPKPLLSEGLGFILHFSKNNRF